MRECWFQRLAVRPKHRVRDASRVDRHQDPSKTLSKQLNQVRVLRVRIPGIESEDFDVTSVLRIVIARHLVPRELQLLAAQSAKDGGGAMPDRSSRDYQTPA